VRSFTALFASLPIFALPLLMGGVTPGEFWRVMLALVASLLVALTAGLCVSAVTRSGITAMGGTALLLGALVFVLWTAADQLGASSAILGGPMSVLQLAFESRFGFQPADFWWALAGCGLLAAGFLVAASVLLTKRWHDTGPANPESWLSRLLRPQMGASAVWGGQSSTENPAVWLAERTLPGRRALWLTIGLGSVICLCAGWLGGSAGTGVIIGVMIASGFLIKLWMALVAPQSLNESRRSGALEILLTTPLSPPALIRGQVDALISYFFAPALASLAAYGFMGVVGGMLGGNQDALEGIAPMIGFWFVWFVFFLIDMFALAYTGLWFGLTEQRPGIAAAKTVVYVLVIPWVTMIVPFIGCLGMIGWPVFWMVWSSRRLNHRFRNEVGSQFAAEAPRSGWWPF
jgi:hypothetical protein